MSSEHFEPLPPPGTDRVNKYWSQVLNKLIAKAKLSLFILSQFEINVDPLYSAVSGTALVPPFCYHTAVAGCTLSVFTVCSFSPVRNNLYKYMHAESYSSQRIFKISMNHPIL